MARNSRGVQAVVREVEMTTVRIPRKMKMMRQFDICNCANQWDCGVIREVPLFNYVSYRWLESNKSRDVQL
jgi:hypothetical protein